MVGITGPIGSGLPQLGLPRLFTIDHSFLPLRSSNSHDRIIGRILNASLVFVKQPDRFECLVAQHKAILVFRLQRIKNDI
jgi:hypothetical protein